MDDALSAAIYSVSSLTALIRQNLAESFPFLWVRGEVTDCSLASSGHLYFSLRDQDALLPCIWFAGKRKKFAQSRKFDPLTGEVYETPPPAPEEMLRNGAEIICAGSLDVYPRNGRYQLIVDHAEAAGLGAAALLLEQRRAKYAEAGYFASERKKKLPPNPTSIALVTSLAGAAIHDFLKLASTRGLSTKIRIFPVPVQGAGAAVKMAEAIAEINRQNEAEVIVLVRGGGSREDLAEFNEDVLVEAIYHSSIPVLAGIGHEVDTFFTDMTADLRAATPSHAAQLLWTPRSDLWQNLDDLSFALSRRMAALLEKNLSRFSHARKMLELLSPWKKLSNLRGRLAQGHDRLGRAIGRLLAERQKQWQCLDKKRASSGNLANKIVNDERRLNYLGRNMDDLIIKFLRAAQKNAAMNGQALARLYAWRIENFGMELNRLEARLEAANPYAPLRRGYVFCTLGGKVLRSARDCKPGDVVTARLCDGEIEMRVLGTRLLPSICVDNLKEKENEI